MKRQWNKKTKTRIHKKKCHRNNDIQKSGCGKNDTNHEN